MSDKWTLSYNGRTVSFDDEIPLCDESTGRIINLILVVAKQEGRVSEYVPITKLIASECS